LKAELKAVLERIGWDTVYEAYIPNLGAANNRGERRACSPFPDISDSHPSFSVNVQSGLWRCFNSERGGDFIAFMAIMRADEFDSAGRAIPDYGKTERDLCHEFHVSKPISVEWLDACRLTLRNRQDIRDWISSIKPWSFEVAYQLKIGFDEGTGRIIFPIYDQSGTLINARMYRPNISPKFIWRVSGEGGNFVWPKEAWNEDPVILCEGEPDVVSLRSHGFAAVCGTLGANVPVPDLRWAAGRHISILMDIDKPGEDAVARCVSELTNIAAQINIIQLPVWEGRPDNADISDYIRFLYVSGSSPTQVITAIHYLIDNASSPSVPTINNEPEERTFRTAICAENSGNRIQFMARVTARSVKRYILPIEMRVTCQGSGSTSCRRCPMVTTLAGSTVLNIDPTSSDVFRMIEVPEIKQLSFIKKSLGISPACEMVNIEPIQSVDVEPILISEPLSEQQDGAEKNYREAYFILGEDRVEEGRDYILNGTVYPHPEEQLGVFLADGYHGAHRATFAELATPELLNELKTFQPASGQTAFEKLCDVADDLADSTTFIYGRRDLHMAYRTIWHSLLSFNFAEALVTRGWLEAIVIGDTRCGKTMTFTRLTELYGSGALVDCTMQSIAGVLGGIEKTSSGKFYALPGVLPNNDGGVICFDEFKSIGGGDLMAAMALPRSEGIVKISKIVGAEFRARVRAIWLANPGKGSLVSQQSLSGIELIQDIIPQPEEIARFDFGMIVRQEDVSLHNLTSVHKGEKARYSKAAHQGLIAWAHSTPAVMFTPQAYEIISALALRMCDKYSSTIPIVEPADQIRRIARVAVSIAVQLYSAENNTVIVKAEHIIAAEQMFAMWYEHSAMGYLEYTDTVRDNTSDAISQDMSIFLRQFNAEDALFIAKELTKLEVIMPTVLNAIIPGGPLAVTQVNPIAVLQRLGCIRPAERGRKMGYEKTATFVQYLRDYIAERSE